MGDKNMNRAVCGAECDKCGYGKNHNCKGCEASGGCPFGKACFIFEYIKNFGAENFMLFKKQLMSEFNALNVSGLPEITELYALNGAFVNLEYPIPSGGSVRLLDDKAVYLGNQVENIFDDGTSGKCYGLVAGLDFLLVCEYGENGSDPEIVVYKRR